MSFRAAVAALLGSAALAGPAMAQEAVVPAEPPSPGHAIVVFPERNMVEADGYRNGQEVTIDVLRDGQSIGTSTAQAEGDDETTEALEGFVEVNHPGGACWTGTGPDIRPGDKIVATSEGSADATTVAAVSAGDYPRYVRDGEGVAVRNEAGEYTIRLSGTAKRPDGTTYPADQLEARLVNPERFTNGARTVRAAVAPGEEGTLDYDAESGRWTAEWLLGEDDAAKAVDAEARIMWLGADPGTGNELTIFEFAATDEGCGSGAAPDPMPLGNYTPPDPFNGASNPPQDGRVIEVFPSRDFVSMAGFNAGETAKVEVFRFQRNPDDGIVSVQRIGLAQNLRPNKDGEIEINHPGGACWEVGPSELFPDLRPRDVVWLTTYDKDGNVIGRDQTTVADARITKDTVVTGAGSIRVEGDVFLPDGSPWPADRIDELEVRLRSTDFRPINGNKQDLRATAAAGEAGTLTLDEMGHFVATFRDMSEEIQKVAVDAATEQRIMWLGADPASGAEATLFERGSEVAGGPGGCDLPPGPGDPVRDTPIVSDPPAGGGPAPGPLPTDPVLVPGIGGVLGTITAPGGSTVLRGQVDEQSLRKLAETGVVSVVLEQKARPNGVLYRFKIRKASGGGGTGRAAAVTAAAAKAPAGRTVATFWRAAPKKAGTFRFRLKSRALRGLSRGRYVVEVTPASAKRKAVGKTMRISFKVR